VSVIASFRQLNWMPIAYNRFHAGICTSRNTRSGENSQRVQVGSPASQAKLEHVPFASERNVEVNATSSNSERAHADNDIDIGVPSLQVIDGDLLFSYSLD
jgi:hypothetical protein